MEEGRCREIQRGGEVVFKGEEKDIQDGFVRNNKKWLACKLFENEHLDE